MFHKARPQGARFVRSKGVAVTANLG